MKKILLALLFLVAPFASHAQEIHVAELSGGMFTYPSANKIPDNGAASIQNFFTDYQGMAVERNGYVLVDSNLGGTSKSVPGMWKFVDNSGNEWIIDYSSRTYYKHKAGDSPVAFGFTATTSNIPRAATNLGKIMFVNGADLPWTFDGTTSTTVATAPLGNVISAWRTRFVIANITGAQSTIRFSRDGDATDWTIGPQAGDPFALFFGGANDGFRVLCVGNYLDNLIVQRKYDTWAVSGFDQSDVQTRNISSEIGCIEPGTNREFDGSYLFLSWRGMEEMRGLNIQLISDPIRNITDVLVKNTSSQRTNVQTTQADFNAGTISPSGTLSTTALVNSVTLATMTATEFDDTTFTGMTLTNTLVSGSSPGVTLLRSSTGTVYSCTSGATQTGAICACSTSQTFQTTFDFSLTSVTIHLARTAAAPGNGTLTITPNGGGATTLGTITMAGVTTVAAGADVTVVNTPYAITANTRYTLTLTATGCTSTLPGTCNAAQNSYFYDYTTNTPCNSTSEEYKGNSAKEINFSLSGSEYALSGTAVSRAYDLGFTTNTWVWLWSTFADNHTLPSGTNVTYETQTSADSTNWDALVSVSSGSNITSTVRRYIRYKGTLTTSNPLVTPAINSVIMRTGIFQSTGGMFTSQLMSIGNSITSWGPVVISDIKTSGNLVYQFGSTTTPSVSAITNWQSIVNNGVPTVSTAPYAAFRSTFSATDGNANVALGEFVTSWTEGGAIPSPISINYDRRYWISLTTNTASTPTLDTVFVYQRNRTWTMLKGINAGSFAIWRDNLYFGDSSLGHVYQFDVGNNDNGSAITSSILTKSYDMGRHYIDKDYRRTYLTFFGGSNGTFNLGYYNDQGTTLYSLGTSNMNDGSGQVFEKYNFPLDGSVPLQGREIQYVLTKSGTGDRLKLFDISLDYMLKEAR